jgi:GntR family transcriptional regulator
MIEILASEGIEVTTIQRRISAVAAPPTVAAWLEVPWGSPTLLYTSVLRDRVGSPIEWIRIYLDPRVVRADGTFHLDTGKWDLEEPM